MFYLQNSVALEGQKLLEDIFDQDVSQGSVSMRMFQPYMKAGSRALVIHDQSGGLALLAATMGCRVFASIANENRTTELLKNYGYTEEIEFHSETIENVLQAQKFELILIKNGVLADSSMEFFPKLDLILEALTENGCVLVMQDFRGAFSSTNEARTNSAASISLNRFLLLLNVPNSLLVDAKFHGFISKKKGWKRMKRLRSILDANFFNNILPKHFLRSASVVIQNKKDLT